MKYYIDFDNTIFDTVSFYGDLLKILNENGITNDYIEKIYQEKGLNPLALIYSIDDLEIRNKSLNHFKNTNKYVYQDTIEFLKNKKDRKFILYTHGYLEYQIKKIENTGIIKYFDDIIIAEDDKTELDIDYTKGIFIDDNTKVLKELLNKKAKKIYRMKRENNRHSKEILESVNIIDIFSMNEVKD